MHIIQYRNGVFLCYGIADILLLPYFRTCSIPNKQGHFALGGLSVRGLSLLPWQEQCISRIDDEGDLLVLIEYLHIVRVGNKGFYHLAICQGQFIFDIAFL